MTRRVAIIGMGNVGAAVAHQLIIEGKVDDLVLIDKNENKVRADAIDFKDALTHLPFHVNIIVNDYERLGEMDVIISTLGNMKLVDPQRPDRFAELHHNKEEVAKVSKKIKRSGFKGILVVVTNPCDAICMLYQEGTGLSKERVIGTGTLLDSARLHRSLGEFFKVHPKSVQGYSLGEHGDSQFVAWSNVSVFDRNIYDLSEEMAVDLEAIEEETRQGGHTVFFGKHYTNYGISAAVVRLVLIILSDAHEELPVSNYREEYGTYLSYPAIVGRQGIIKQCQLKLTDEELEKLKRSAGTILAKANYSE